MKLKDLAEALGCALHGDGKIEITGVLGMEQAGPQHLTFLANPKYAHKVKLSRAGAILVTQAPAGAPMACLISANPYLDFSRALELFYQPPRPPAGVHPLAFVDATAEVGENASIGPFAVIGARVKLGKNAVLHPHAVVYEGAEIGDNFYAHSHSTVREFCRIGNRVICKTGW
jgi:UDP-3-O-[3-hydroxymyristoyl] glucosamine N-acyltransferase